MKTIKLIKLIAIAMMMATVFNACKKDKAPPTVSIEGKWVGSQIIEGIDDPDPLNFTLKSDGVIDWFDANDLNKIPISSEYKLAGTVFTAKYPLGDGTSYYTYTATFDSNKGTLTGGTVTDTANGTTTTIIGASWKATKQ